jgi:hypothetical protein
MLFVLGGNGTHAGANAIHAEVFKSCSLHQNKLYGLYSVPKNILASLKHSSLDHGIKD